MSRFTKGFGKFCGKLKTLLKSKKCGCDESLCDDACDAAMVNELMVPGPSVGNHRHHHHTHSAPAPPAPTPLNRPYTGPTKNLRLAPMGPSQWDGQPMMDPPHADIQLSQPPIAVPEPAGQHLGSPEMRAVPPPVRIGEETLESDEAGSLFDTLSDPFGDDQVRVRPFYPVRPSSYQEESSYQKQDVDGSWLRPISRRPLP